MFAIMITAGVAKAQNSAGLPSFSIAHADTVSGEPATPRNDAFDAPFFTRPITDFLEENTFSGQVRRTDSLITQRRRIDLSPHDFTGRSSFPGANDLYPSLANSYEEAFNVRYNRVDGFFLGLSSQPLFWNPGSQIGKFYGSLGYAFGAEDWQYSIGYERILGMRNAFKIGAGYHRMTFSDDLWRIGLSENTLFSLFAGYDYLDYHLRQGFNAYAVFRTTQYIEHTLRFRTEEYESQDVATRYSFFGSRSNVRDNPAITDGYMQSLEWTTGFQTGGLILNNRLIFEGDVRLELGDLDFLDSDFSFTRYETEIRTIFRFDPANMLQWRVRAGTSTAQTPVVSTDPLTGQVLIEGGLPEQKKFALGGIGSMRGRSFKSMTGSQMILSNLELHFSNYRRTNELTDKIDWYQYKLYLFLDSGWVNKNAADPSDPFAGFDQFSISDLKHDIGFGISFSESRFSVLRFELAWPLEDLKASPNLIVRFNPTF